MHYLIRFPVAVLVLGFITLSAHPGSASAATDSNTSCEAPAGFPDRPIEVIVRFGPGGGADILARTVTSIIHDNHPDLEFNVLNIPGGNSLRAVEEFMSRPADGHAILNTDATLVLAPLLGQTRHDLGSYLHLVRANADVIAFAARPDDPRFPNAKAMIEWAKANPGELTVSTTGILSSLELNTRYFHELAGYEARNIGYAKAGERRAAVIGGHVDVLAENLSSMSATLENGELEPILVLADERIPQYPDVPTAKELGIDYSWGQVRGYALKRGTSPEIADYLECVFLEALRSEEYSEWEASKGIPNPGTGALTGDAWRKFLKEETERQKEVLRTFGLLQ